MTVYVGIVIIAMLWQMSTLRGAPVKVPRSADIIQTSASYNQPIMYQPGYSTGRIFEEETHQSSSTSSSTLLSGSTERSQGSFSLTAITPKLYRSTLSPSHSVQTSTNTKFSVDHLVQTKLNNQSSSDETALTSINTFSNTDQSAKITVNVNPVLVQTTEKANMSVGQSFSSTNADDQTITRILDEPKTDGTIEIANNFDFSSKSDATDIHITDAKTSPAIVSHDTSIRRLVKRSTGVRVTNETPRISSSTITPDTTAKSENSTAGGTSTSEASADISYTELSKTEVSTLPENKGRDSSTAPFVDDALLISFFTSTSKSRYLSIIARSLSSAADLSKRNAMFSCTTIRNVPQSICEQIFSAGMLKGSENVTCTNIKSSFTHALQMIKSAWASASYFFSSGAGKYPFMPFLKTAANYIGQIGSVCGLPVPSTALLPTGTPVPDYDRDLRFLGELYSQIKLVDSIMMQIRSCFSIS